MFLAAAPWVSWPCGAAAAQNRVRAGADEPMRAADCDAVLFDLDGVLTDTAAVHEQAWGRLFTELFEVLAAGGTQVRPYSVEDYFLHIDGKPRVEGIQAILSSRGLSLPVGGADDHPDAMTVNGLGNRKNAMFLRTVDEDGVRLHRGAAEILRWLDLQQIPKGVVSSSRNADVVLRAAALRDGIDVLVDGVAAELLGLPGKPAPDTYLHAARELRADPGRTVVVEDATSGTRAGRDGGFWVIAVDRGAGRAELIGSGAHVVVDELDEIFLDDRARAGSVRPVP